jgi:hypothetical protein
MFVVEKRLGGLSEEEIAVRSRDSGLRRIENIFQDMCIYRTQPDHLLWSSISCMAELYRKLKAKVSSLINKCPSRGLRVAGN